MECAGIEMRFKVTTPEDAEVVKTWNPDTRLVFFSGEIRPTTDKTIISLLEVKAAGERLLLVLTTPGGDADAAYRLARYCQASYKHFAIGVFSECKSSGTLLALGAHELVLSNRGELGPLDVQMFRPDEFMQMSSGLTISQALDYLSDKVFESWESIFLQIRARSQGVVTTKTAAEIACSIVTGLYSPISDKIDPQRFGEMQRSLHIATEYGKRLGVREAVVEHLCTGYPSHSFVIDLQEAQSLLENVRVPTAFEEILVCNAAESLRKEYKVNPVRQIAPEGFIGIVNVTIEHEAKGEQENESASQDNAAGAGKTAGVSSGEEVPGQVTGHPEIKVTKDEP